jgi:hypothetical protein
MIKYFDFDGTLARFDCWQGQESTGEPVPEMVDRVQDAIRNGDEAVIFTARLTPGGGYGPCDPAVVTRTIENWCLTNIGKRLSVANIKGAADVIYDDRAYRIVRNTGLTEGEFVANIVNEEMQSNNTKEQSLKRILEHINVIEGEQ